MANKGLTKQELTVLKKTLLEEEIKTKEMMRKLQANDPFNDPDHVNDNAAVDTDIREQLGHDTIEAEIKSFERRLELIHEALRKVEKGTYGLCEHSHEPIGFARLQLVPEAKYCIDHNKQLVK